MICTLFLVELYFLVLRMTFVVLEKSRQGGDMSSIFIWWLDSCQGGERNLMNLELCNFLQDGELL